MHNYFHLPKQHPLTELLVRAFCENGGKLTIEQFRKSIKRNSAAVLITNERIMTQKYICYETFGETIYHCGLVSLS